MVPAGPKCRAPANGRPRKTGATTARSLSLRFACPIPFFTPNPAIIGLRSGQQMSSKRLDGPCAKGPYAGPPSCILPNRLATGVIGWRHVLEGRLDLRQGDMVADVSSIIGPNDMARLIQKKIRGKLAA